MLIYRRTSILESPAQTLVNTVNCVGIMGKGLAQAFRDREPAMYEAYRRICEQELLTPGRLWLWRGSDSWILNFPTKKHWRHPSRLEWIEAGLEKFVAAHEEQGIREVSFPRLGCGNGGLDWEDVRPLMEQYLSPLKIPTYIHDYTVDIGLPEHLEAIARTLRSEGGVVTNFDAFVISLRKAIALSGSRLVELTSERPFAATMSEENDLVIEASDADWRFEMDDLRSVWITLQKGLVTGDRAGWSVGGGGAPMVSLLSLLPEVRAIQIQRPQMPSPEIAVELKPDLRGIATATQSHVQRQLAWD